jgi:hypothetical protein
MGIDNIRFGLSRWLIAHIVVRFRELYGLEENTPLDDAIKNGSVCQATYDEYCEISGMFKFLSAVQTIVEERQTMADFFICAARGLRLSGMRMECGVQCDIESQSLLDPGDMCTDTVHTTLTNLTHDYQVCTYHAPPFIMNMLISHLYRLTANIFYNQTIIMTSLQIYHTYHHAVHGHCSP